MLTRTDGCPLQEDKLTFELKSWLSVTGETINSSFSDIEKALNVLTAQSYTAEEITGLTPSITNGVLLYDTTNNVYVGMQSGSLVKFTTSAYP
jgi:hypothetical protein